MNPKRLILAIVVVFVGVWVTDFLIHGVWLQGAYRDTVTLWRSEAEMQSHLGWLMLGQFLFAAAFTTLWARGFAATGCLKCACIYGLFMGGFSQAMTIITYAVQPFPANIAVSWFVSGLIQGVLMGVLVKQVYRPKPETVPPPALA